MKLSNFKSGDIKTTALTKTVLTSPYGNNDPSILARVSVESNLYGAKSIRVDLWPDHDSDTRNIFSLSLEDALSLSNVIKSLENETEGFMNPEESR